MREGATKFMFDELRWSRQISADIQGITLDEESAMTQPPGGV